MNVAPNDSSDERKRLEKLEKLARNNRALLILLIVASPLIAFVTFYSLDLQIRDGKSQVSIQSREFSIPGEAKLLISVFGIGGLFGLSKEQIIKLINKEK